MDTPTDDASAVEAMRGWLTSSLKFRRPPARASVVFRTKIPWEEGQVAAFLVAYEMPDGVTGVGFTGPVTWSFVDVPLAAYGEIPASHRWQRVVNLYCGWYLAFTAEVPPLATKMSLLDALPRYLTKREYTFQALDPVHGGAATIGKSDFHVVKCWTAFQRAADGPTTSDVRSRNPADAAWLGVVVRRSSQAVDYAERIESLDVLQSKRAPYNRLPLYHFVGTRLGPFRIERWQRLAYDDPG